jgi:hypothetical protein
LLEKNAMTVDEFSEILRDRKLEFVSDGWYQNQFGQKGYRAIYRDPARYYWFSVSGTETPFALDEVALAIRTPGRQITREYPYRNRNQQQGFEATVRSGEHSFMLCAAPDPPRFHRLRRVREVIALCLEE